jgi:alpha-glucosidase
MRALPLHYCHDKDTWNINDEFLLGESMLVAPVLTQGSRKRIVYFPKVDIREMIHPEDVAREDQSSMYTNRWFDFETGKQKQKGGDYTIVDAPIDTCPVFVKAGSIIPMYPLRQYIQEADADELFLRVFKGIGEYRHYEDNGSDYAYRDGKYNEYLFKLEYMGSNDYKLDVSLTHHRYSHVYKRFTVEFEGTRTALDFNGDQVSLMLTSNYK